MSVLPEVELGFQAEGAAGWTVIFGAVTEAISEVYEGTLILSAPLSLGSPDALVGARAMYTVNRAGHERTVKGVVRRVEDLGSTATHRYVRVVLVPALWTLSQRHDSRIFQDKPVVDIVRDVLRVAGVYQGDGELVIPGGLQGLAPREYCVQYRETDLAFILRLLQEEGIPFHFTHDGDGGETLVLVDDTPQWPAAPLLVAGHTVDVLDEGMHTTSFESLKWFESGVEMRPTSMTIRDYDFTRPRATIDMTPVFPNSGGARPIYDYPSRKTLYEYDDETHAYPMHDGQRQARVRHEAQQSPGRTGAGSGNVTGFAAGHTFTLRGHLRSDLDQRYLLTRVEHRAQAFTEVPEELRASEHLLDTLRDAGMHFAAEGRTSISQRYMNRFACMPASVPFRAARVTARPIVHGSQTARVVGPAGEEIYTDFHGRVKVQFHWDRLGQEDEKSSCWIRVSQNWASGGWGFVFIPRVGMEVVVTFLEGDPDKPLITGCVYNGENNTPYELPKERTKSTIKTNSTPTTGGYNEIRFEDAAGQEQIYIQAEHNMDTLVKFDQTLTVQRNRTKLIEGHERNSIQLDRVTRVQGNEAKEVQGNQDVEVHGVSGHTMQVDHNYMLTADDSLTLTCGGSTVQMTPSEILVSSSTVRVLGSKLVEVKGGLVKINCGDGAGAPSSNDKKQSNTAQTMQQAFAAALKALPAQVRAALKKGLGAVMQQALAAAMNGTAPDLKNVANAALGAALGSASQSLAQGLGALGQALGAGDNPVVGTALQMAQRVAQRGVQQGLRAANAMRAALRENPAWQQLERDNPEAAQAALRRASSTLMRAEMRNVRVPAEAGAGGTRMFDGTAASARRAHVAGLTSMMAN
jgi:type VI secretion system secreted protein VgrG